MRLILNYILKYLDRNEFIKEFIYYVSIRKRHTEVFKNLVRCRFENNFIEL